MDHFEQLVSCKIVVELLIFAGIGSLFYQQNDTLMVLWVKVASKRKVREILHLQTWTNPMLFNRFPLIVEVNNSFAKRCLLLVHVLHNFYYLRVCLTPDKAFKGNLFSVQWLNNLRNLLFDDYFEHLSSYEQGVVWIIPHLNHWKDLLNSLVRLDFIFFHLKIVQYWSYFFIHLISRIK